MEAVEFWNGGSTGPRSAKVGASLSNSADREAADESPRRGPGLTLAERQGYPAPIQDLPGYRDVLSKGEGPPVEKGHEKGHGSPSEAGGDLFETAPDAECLLIEDNAPREEPLTMQEREKRFIRQLFANYGVDSVAELTRALAKREDDRSFHQLRIKNLEQAYDAQLSGDQPGSSTDGPPGSAPSGDRRMLVKEKGGSSTGPEKGRKPSLDPERELSEHGDEGGDDDDDDDDEGPGGGGGSPSAGAPTTKYLVLPLICFALPITELAYHVQVLTSAAMFEWIHAGCMADSGYVENATYLDILYDLGMVVIPDSGRPGVTRRVRSRFQRNLLEVAAPRGLRVILYVLPPVDLPGFAHPLILLRGTVGTGLSSSMDQFRSAEGIISRKEGRRPTFAGSFMRAMERVPTHSPDEDYVTAKLVYLMTTDPASAQTGGRLERHSKTLGLRPLDAHDGPRTQVLDKAPAVQLVRNVIPEPKGTLISWTYSIVQLCQVGVHHDLANFLLSSTTPVETFLSAIRERLKACRLLGFTAHDAARLDSVEARQGASRIKEHYVYLPYMPQGNATAEDVDNVHKMIRDIMTYVRSELCQMPKTSLRYHELRQILSWNPRESLTPRERLAEINGVLQAIHCVWGPAEFNRLVSTKGDQLFEVILKQLPPAERERLIYFVNQYCTEVIKPHEGSEGPTLSELRGISTYSETEGLRRIAWVDLPDDFRVLIEHGHFWGIWSLVGSRIARDAEYSPATPVSINQISEGPHAGRTVGDVLDEAGEAVGTPGAHAVLALPSRVADFSYTALDRDRQQRTSNDKDVPSAQHAASAPSKLSPPLPAAAPNERYGASLHDQVSTMSDKMNNFADQLAGVAKEFKDHATAVDQRLSVMEQNGAKWVDGLRRDGAAANLGVQEQLRTVGKHLPGNHASAGASLSHTPSASRQMPVTTRYGQSGNYRNDPGNRATAAPAKLATTIVPRDTNRARGPGFGLQFTNFEPVKYMDIDEDRRAEFAEKCQIVDEPSFLEHASRAPCFWCGGNHLGHHCPGGCWACTPQAREKVGAAVSEATRLKYDARRAATRQRQLLTAFAPPSDKLNSMLDEAERVPVYRLEGVVGDEAVQRICALVDCTDEDDVSVFVEWAHEVMHDSCMYAEAAKSRRQ